MLTDGISRQKTEFPAKKPGLMELYHIYEGFLCASPCNTAKKNRGEEEQRLCCTRSERRTYNNGGHVYWKRTVGHVITRASHVYTVL